MSYFIIEIGCEDLPEWIGEYFKENFIPVFTREIKEKRINFEEISLFYTNRRIILYGKNVSPFQNDYIAEISGPPADIGIDKNGKYTLPAIKFAESQNVKVNQLKIKEKNNKKVLVAIKKEKGNKTYKLLPDIFLTSLKKIEIPRSMNWNEENIKFIRPIRSILSLFDNKTIPIKYGNIKSSNFTSGHRVLSPKKIKIKHIKEYPDKMLKNFVIFDQNVREKFIEEKIKNSLPFQCRYDENLVKNISNLVEYPILKIGEISEKYKGIPDRVKEVVIKKLKCIPLFTSDSSLYNKFIIVLDGVDKEEIKTNYESVIINKLEDANFFIKKDTQKPLKLYLDDLKKIVFHPKWGSIYERVERLQKIFECLKEKLDISETEEKNIKEIISLCKNDLATLMVTEFPELQGVIGRIYAEKEGYEKVISLSIEEHYLPEFTGDKIPEFKEGCIVSIIDKLETLVCFIIEGIEPTASTDPYGLKKMANGIIEIIWKKELNFPLKESIKEALFVFNNNEEKIVEKILNFFLQRVDNLLAVEDIIPGIRKSVISVEKENLLTLRKKIDALKEFLKTEKGIDVFVPFVRIANILKQAGERKISFGQFDENLLVEDEEKKLYEFYKKQKEKYLKLNEENNFSALLNTFAEWRDIVDNFFDEVLVMSPDEKLRNNRLSLLNKINQLFSHFADFSYLSLKEIEDAKKI